MREIPEGEQEEGRKILGYSKERERGRECSPYVYNESLKYPTGFT